jgi:RNA polymerase sigma-70 factor, ECF subfamily
VAPVRDAAGGTGLESSDSDADLLRAAGRGDDAAFHTLVDRHGAALFRVALSFSHNTADAEDLVQETLIAAYRGSKGFAGRSSVKTWLLRILTNEATRAWRRGQKRRGTLSLDAAPGGRETVRDVALTHRGAQGSVDHRLDIATILQELTPSHREILVMREIWDLSYDEIAAALGIPRGTVESRLSRARAQFRKRFEGDDDVDEGPRRENSG